MRVLHIGKFFPPFAGGMENFLGDLHPALRRLGVESAVLVHDHRFGNRRCHVLPPVPFVVRASCLGVLLYAPVSPTFAWAMRRMIRAFEPDLLHFHLPNTSAFWALAMPEARRLPWVIHWHADVVPSEHDKRLSVAYHAYRPFEWAMLKHAGRIMATSPPYFRTSRALIPWRPKCTVVPLGLDPARLALPEPEDLQWARAQWKRPGLRILSVGRLTYYKGHDFLIKAAAKRPETTVLIVGKGEKRAELETLIRALGLGRRVRLMGELTDRQLFALMVSCDGLCLPSIERTEAFGLVLLEAMRYGKPVVASDVRGSGMAWVVRSGESGLLVDPGDSEGLVAAFATLAQPGKKEALGRAALVRFQNCFHIHQVADRVVQVYRETLGGKVAWR